MPHKTRTEKTKTLQIAGVPESDISRFVRICDAMRKQSGIDKLPAWRVFGRMMDIVGEENA